MTHSANLSVPLEFLDALSAHNHKAWFEAHRAEYTAARDVFFQFIDRLIDEVRVADQLGGLMAPACTARIHRDIRFSKDKSPYNTNFSAMIAPGGWHGAQLGYYVGLGPRGQSLVAGGLYRPTPAQLARFREAVAEDAAPFTRLTRAKAFVGAFGAVAGERLKTAPQGYDRDHPAIALLQLKQVLAMRAFTDAEVLAPDFAARVLSTCRAMRPFLNYLTGLLP